MKSALFVDFDNIYSGLRQLDQASADRFARHPMEWMNWVVKSLDLPEHVSQDARRRVLVRRCYLNPQVYQRFRPFFNLAGFEIIDCPALTAGGKTSTDIHMVLDIIDLLQHEAHYDEFIVFSADADFTPVLRKLRRWDRRTTVLAIGFPSAAYRASADLVIDQDEFVRSALGIVDLDEAANDSPAVPGTASIVAGALAVIRSTVAKSATPVPFSQLAIDVLSKVAGIDASTWGSYGSFGALLQANNLSPLTVLARDGGYVFDAERHSEPQYKGNQPASSAKTLDSIADLVRQEIQTSRTPVPCAKIASTISRDFNAIATDWNGKGTFRKFLESLDLAPLSMEWKSAGGYIYDPQRHSAGMQTGDGLQQGDWDNEGQILTIAKQIHEITGVPLLPPRKYRGLFEQIAVDVSTADFHFIETGKRIRDKCREAGNSVSRADVTFTLRGLLLRGHLFNERSAAADLSRIFASHVRSLCLREQIILDSQTDSAIRRWIEVGE